MDKFNRFLRSYSKEMSDDKLVLKLISMKWKVIISILIALMMAMVQFSSILNNIVSLLGITTIFLALFWATVKARQEVLTKNYGKEPDLVRYKQEIVLIKLLQKHQFVNPTDAVISRYKIDKLLNFTEQQLSVAVRIHTIYLKVLTSAGVVASIFKYLVVTFQLQSLLSNEAVLTHIIQGLGILIIVVAILPTFVNKRYNLLQNLQSDLYNYIFSIPFEPNEELIERKRFLK